MYFANEKLKIRDMEVIRSGLRNINNVIVNGYHSMIPTFDAGTHTINDYYIVDECDSIMLD